MGILQIITGIFLGLHYTSDLNSAYSSLFFFIREIYYGWCLRLLHSSGASFVFLFLFLHLGRAISYASYFYNPIFPNFQIDKENESSKITCFLKTAIFFHNFHDYCYIPRVEAKERECWKILDWRLNS